MVHVWFSPLRRSRLLHGPSLAFAVTALLTGCSRTSLEIDDGLTLQIVDAADDQTDANVAEDAAAPVTNGVDAAPPLPAAPPSAPPAAPPADPCADMPPIPCPGGGFEYCIAGQYSACPKRCGMCVPGSQQVCFISYCHSWGVQTCAADGLSFGYCQEQSPPLPCQSIADTNHASAALEQCCIDNGYCCQDQFDLNKNGTTGEPIGQCSGVTCSP
jgi:hypothetical protein